MKPINIIGFLGVLVWLSAGSTATADWMVQNNLNETFTVYVWPSGTPKAIKTCKISPGKSCRIPLGEDTHEVELVSSGGDVYILEPTSLRDREGATGLKTILTPKRKENGRTIFQFMNQEGFNQGEQERIDDVKWSAWTTTYRTPNGGNVKTDFKLAGATGTYNGGRGRLSDVTYQQNGDGWIITGKWVFDQGAASGTFTFYVNDDGSGFSSNADQSASSWGGSRRWPRN